MTVRIFFQTGVESTLVPHDWDFVGSFVLGGQRDTGMVRLPTYLTYRLSVHYSRLMRLLIFTGVPQNECRFSDFS